MENRYKSAAGGTKKCILAIVLAALLLAVSVLCIVEIHDHDCTGDECPVCAMVVNFEHTAKSVLAAGAAAGCLVFGWILLRRCAPLVLAQITAASPVSLGIRSNS